MFSIQKSAFLFVSLVSIHISKIYASRWDNNRGGYYYLPPPVVDLSAYGVLNQNIPNIYTNINEQSYNTSLSNALTNNILELSKNIVEYSIQANPNSKSQIVSPTSIAGALMLLLLGANSQTYNELKNLFKLDDIETFRYTPYRAHEEFSYLIEDLMYTRPNLQRPRKKSAWWNMNRNDYLRQDDKKSIKPFKDEDHQIRFANGIFIQNGFKLRPEYKSAVEDNYQSEIETLDFDQNEEAARRFINNWVYEKTNGRIDEIITQPLESQTKMIATSTLYFKALWEKHFLLGATRMDNFFPNEYQEQPIQVEFMANIGAFPYYDSVENGCEIFGLPYKGNLTAMYIILPYNSSRQRLIETQAELTSQKIEEMIGNMTIKTAILALPKMHIRSSFSLVDILYQMGVKTLFSESESDLSLIAEDNTIMQSYKNSDNYYNRRQKRGITYKTEKSGKSKSSINFKDFAINKRLEKSILGKKSIRNRREISSIENFKNLDFIRNTQYLNVPKLFANDILHKVDLRINELGTEGAATTTTILMKSGADIIFRVNKPFMILIQHDETKLPLFYGSIFEPEN